MQSLIEILAGIFEEIVKLILKFIWKHNEYRRDKTILKRNKMGGYVISRL